jgi:cell division septum initiation protein DivIVA
MHRQTLHRMLNFDLSLLGYNRGQVDRHIDKLNRRLSDAMVTFDSAIALQHELNAAREEIDNLRKVAAHFPHHTRLGEQITEILMLAEEQAATIRAEAEDEAKTIRAEAEEEAKTIRGEAEQEVDGAAADSASVSTA